MLMSSFVSFVGLGEVEQVNVGVVLWLRRFLDVLYMAYYSGLLWLLLLLTVSVGVPTTTTHKNVNN